MSLGVNWDNWMFEKGKTVIFRKRKQAFGQLFEGQMMSNFGVWFYGFISSSGTRSIYRSSKSNIL